MLILATIAAALAAAPAAEPEKMAKVIAKAKPVGSCQGASDCAEKLSRARSWVSEHTVFAIRDVSPSSFITEGPDFNSPRPAYAVVIDPPASGSQAIRARVWCGNPIGCHPSPKSALRDLAAAVSGS